MNFKMQNNRNQHTDVHDAIYKFFIQQSGDGIALINHKANIVEWNKSMEQISGIKRADIINTKIWDYEFSLLPENLQQEQEHKAIKETINKLLTANNRQEYEGTYKVHGEETRYYKVKMFKIEANEHFYIGRITTDITHQKQSQIELNRYKNHLETVLAERTKSLADSLDKYQKLFDDASDAIIIMENLSIVDCNQQACLLFGYTKNALLIMSAIDLSPEWQDEDGERSEILAERKINDLKAGRFKIFEWKHLHANGSIIYTEVSLNFITIDNRKLIQATVRDITEKKLINMGLKERQAILDAVFENIPFDLWVRNIYDVCILQNSQSIQLWGNQISATSEELNAPAVFIENCQKAYKGQTIYFNLSLVSKSGNTRILSCIVAPVKSDNEIIGILGMSIDITKQKVAEKALKESEEKFSKAFYLSPNAMVIFDIKTQIILDTNNSFERLSGRPQIKIIGRKFYEKNVWFVNGQLDKLSAALSKMHKLWNFEFSFRNIDNKINHCLISAEKINYSNNDCVLLTLHNITNLKAAEIALKSSEQKFRNIFKSSLDAIAITSIDGIIIECNPKISENFDIQRTDILGKKLDVLTAIPVDKIRQKVSENGFFEFEVMVTCKYNQKKFFNTVANKIIYIDAPALLIIFRNITELKEMERNMLHAVIKTEEKEKSRFAQDLHDGIGPLLSTAKFYIQLMEEDDADKTQMLEIINKLGDVVNEAITNIKEISNNISPHILKNFGLNAAIGTFVKKYDASHFPDINFISSLNKRFSDDIEIVLYRVITELINNSIKHANAKSVFIRLYQRAAIVKLHYSDDGIGFDINKEMTSKAGMGIANIKNRIKTLDGTVEFISKPNVGVKIKISIKTDRQIVNKQKDE